MIATIQIGNSDDKLSQQEWSTYVKEIRLVVNEYGIETLFFGSSEGSQPWQNACWVVAVRETDVGSMFRQITKIRKRYKQDWVAVVLGDVRLI